MSTYYERKFGTDHEGECDMRAEAEEMARGEAHDRFYGIDDDQPGDGTEEGA